MNIEKIYLSKEHLNSDLNPHVNDLPLKIGGLAIIQNYSNFYKHNGEIYFWAGDQWIFKEIMTPVAQLSLTTSYFEPVTSSVDESNPKNIITLLNYYTGELITFEETNTYIDGTLMNDNKVDDIVFVKKDSKYFVSCDFINKAEINVVRFGADRSGRKDSTQYIQKAYDLANKLYGGDVSANTGHAGWFVPEVIFPTGKYKCGKINIYNRVRSKGIGQVVIESRDGTKDSFKGQFVNNNVSDIYFENFTFLFFDTVFKVPTSNIDFSFITFKNINIAKCNLFVDTVSYSLSRSTSIKFERCRALYGLKKFCKIYCDKAEFNSNWFIHSEKGIFIEVDSCAYFNNNMYVPTVAFIDKAWIKFTGSDKARGLSFVSERFGGEQGQCPVLVVGDVNQDNSNTQLRQQGVVFENCFINSYNIYNPLNINGGNIRSAVVLEKPSSPIRSINFISFRNCQIQPNINAVSTYNSSDNLNFEKNFVISFDYVTSIGIKKALGDFASTSLSSFVKQSL